MTLLDFLDFRFHFSRPLDFREVLYSLLAAVLNRRCICYRRRKIQSDGHQDTTRHPISFEESCC